MSLRDEKLSEALREAAAEFLAREAGRQSLVTVTRAMVGDKGKTATIYISVLPETAEAAAVGFANRHRSEFGTFFSKKFRGIRVPQVEFAIDLGEKNRLRMEELLP